MGEEKKGFFKRLVSGLTKTRDNIVSGIDSIFHGFSNIDDDFYEELEEILIMGDIGVHATMDIIEDLKQKVKENHIKEPVDCKEFLIESIKKQMDVGEAAYEFEHQTSVVLVIGVNGVGKTTSIGKIAHKCKQEGKTVMLAAADVVISRAGAMSVNELQICGKPSILIPSPYVAENHQFHNAMSLKRINAAELIEEKDLNGDILLKTVRSMLNDKQRLEEMSRAAKSTAITDADRKIAEIIINLAKK